MRHLPLLSLLALGAAAYGCSLINAPDDVVGSAGSSTGATSNLGGQDGEGGSPDTGGTNSTGQGGEGNTSPGGDGSGGAPEVDPGPGPDPKTGLVVLGTKDGDNKRYLSVLAPNNGSEIVSEPLPVAAVAYDEAPGRHLWFVFTASAFPASQTGTADLEVRRFNEATGRWFVVGKSTALPPPQPDQLVVVNDRLVYLSYRVVDGAPVTALTVLDTSDPTDVSELTTQPAPDGEDYVGVVGDRGSDVDANAEGGRLRLMIAQNCNNQGCELSAQQVFVAASLTSGTSVLIDRFVGQPRFAKGKVQDRLYVALRSTTPTNRLAVRSLEGPDLTNPTAFALTGFVGDDVGGLALAECANAGVVTDVDGDQVFAFELTSGRLQTVDLEHPGAPVYADPLQPSVITLDPTGAPGLRSFEVSRSGADNVAINERSSWKPNFMLSPYTGAMRVPESADCP